MAGLRNETPSPESITLHGASRVLEVGFSDGSVFRLPFELLRVCSPSAEVQGHSPSERKTVPDCWLRLTIREGRNRQVRRMTAAIGHPTLRLVRWSIGDWTIEGLSPGEWREAPLPTG